MRLEKLLRHARLQRISGPEHQQDGDGTQAIEAGQVVGGAGLGHVRRIVPSVRASVAGAPRKTSSRSDARARKLSVAARTTVP